MLSNSNKSVIIYHAGCWDGFCSAWILQKFIKDAEMVPANYGEDPPSVTGKDVYILDFSYKRPVMRQIMSEARFVVVLDHHKTAQAELAGIVDEFIMRPDLIHNPDGSELPFVHFNMEKSGARLTLEYVINLLGVDTETLSRMSWLVDYTEDRDLWRHSLEHTREINAALRSYPLGIATWDKIAEDGPGVLVSQGEAIRRYEKNIVRSHVGKWRAACIGGYFVPCVNATVMFSEIAGDLAKGQPFGACYFDRRDGKRQFSLRSDEGGIDVSEIAKRYGGGGHEHAAGFELSDLSLIAV